MVKMTSSVPKASDSSPILSAGSISVLSFLSDWEVNYSYKTVCKIVKVWRTRIAQWSSPITPVQSYPLFKFRFYLFFLIRKQILVIRLFKK